MIDQDLTKLTRKEHKAIVTELAEKPLKELRRRQTLVEQQTARAFEQKNDLALGNLQVMGRHLTAAIDLKAFG